MDARNFRKLFIGCIAGALGLVALVFVYIWLTTGAAYYRWHSARYPAQNAAKFEDVAQLDRLFKRDPKALNSQDDEGMTPLADAVVQERSDLVEWLLNRGADPTIPNKNGLTPLDHACGRNKTVGTQLAKLLLAKGANPNEPDIGGGTPLSWAVSSDNTELAKLLLERGADPKARGGYILRNAAGRGDTEIVAMLIEHGADPKAMSDGTTPLHDAAWGGREEVMKLLLSKGADPNVHLRDGSTPLLYAAGPGADQHGVACLEILLANGVDINAADAKGNTPLHTAAAYGNKEAVETLLAHGADVSAKNKSGETPLDFARQSEVSAVFRRHAQETNRSRAIAR